MNVGVKAFVVHRKKVLLLLRDNNPLIAHPNAWSLPGGGVESGEHYDEAIRRELQEELRIQPRMILCLGIETFDDGKSVVRYLVRLNDNEAEKLRLGEGQAMRFFSPNETLLLPLSPHLENFLKKNAGVLRKMIEENENVSGQDLGLAPCNSNNIFYLGE
ncbi:MAG: NUDIX domain-containing protein [Patescibacteria group bacterium]